MTGMTEEKLDAAEAAFPATDYNDDVSEETVAKMRTERGVDVYQKKWKLIDALGQVVPATDYDVLAAKLAEVKASSQGWIDAAVEQQVRRKRAEERILEVEAERDDLAEGDAEATRLMLGAQKRMRAAQARADAAEAALPAVYQLALEDAVNTLRTKQNHMYTTRCDEFVQTHTRDVLEMADMIEASPTPTAAELMARIQTGEKE